MSLVLFSPMPTTELALRVGMGEDVDMGLRYAGSLIKLDAKKQLIDGDPGLDLALDLGYSYHLGIGASWASRAYDVVDLVGLGEYSRHDLDGAVIVGRDFGQWLSIYGATRYMASFISLDSDITTVETGAGTGRTSIDNTMHLFGGSFGSMIGYRYLFLTSELTIMKVIFEPTLVGQQLDLSGVVYTPTLGLTARY
jgi:hypothetical protein